MSSDKVTDPYGCLAWAVGSGDDFVCFDYRILGNGKVRLHAVLNSETGAFIQDFCPPETVPARDAVRIAVGMTDRALEWCADNNVRHDTRGWNQDPFYFARCVAHSLKRGPRAPGRKSGKVPLEVTA